MGQKGAQRVEVASAVPAGKATYVDTFEHGFDTKGRITVPAEWRDAGYEQQLFVMPSAEGCLKVYPNSWMSDQQVRLADKPVSDPQRKKLVALSAISQKVSWDEQGRIKVGERHLKHAGLSKEAVLVGAFDHFEIWEPSRRAAVAPAALTLEDLDL